jgi:signal transduction histidine kinase
MIHGRYRSLQLRLAVRLAALYLAATAVVAAVLIYRAYDTASTLNDRELSLRAADLAQFVAFDPKGIARLQLPAALAAAYAAAPGTDIYAIRGAQGSIVAASPLAFGQLVAAWPTATDDPSYFHLNDFGDGSKEYFGLSLAEESAAGMLSISVARAAGADALIHSVLKEFLLDVAWLLPVLVLVTLAIGVWAIRSGLRPIRDVSRMAGSIGPNTTSVRLPERNLPSEILPLVMAVNRALDRLDQGFAVQRQFTANAAHELRTPLAIVTAALESIEENGDIAKVRADVARMNRLVEQLLRVARLDAVALDVSQIMDLNETVMGVVENMAPWALAQRRMIAFSGPESPIVVRGNSHAVADAVRNLIENAVHHTPVRTEVLVAINAEGCVSVADHGPGIPASERTQIFERFWRGKTSASHGAGLGLAIVQEIVKAHGGALRVEDNPTGGAIIRLSLPLASGPACP